MIYGLVRLFAFLILAGLLFAVAQESLWLNLLATSCTLYGCWVFYDVLFRDPHNDF